MARSGRRDYTGAMARPTSIAARLFVLVFGFSVAWSTLTTAVQVVFEYRGARVSIDASLEDLFLATRAGLDTALWSYDLDLVTQGLDELRSVRFLSGALVRDEKGTVLASWGNVPPMALSPALREGDNVDALTEPLYHRFAVNHADSQGNPRYIGDLVLFVDFPVLTSQLADRIRLIVSNYLASTLGLMVILLLGLRRLVGQPLGRITRAIGDYRFDRAGFRPPESEPRRPDELTVLWKSFESLTEVLKESWLQQRVMSAILEEADVMALVCDDEGRVVSSNAQARSRLGGGYPGGRLEGLTYGGQDQPLFASTELLTQGKAWRGELEVLSSEGRSFRLSAALLPLEVPDEPRARWGVMIEDVTAQRLTDKYRQERDLARESARNKSLFLANLSHEIRTPMNAVVGLTALALDEELSPRARQFLVQLQQSGSSLLGVINDILDFSKLEEGKVGLEWMDVTVAELLQRVESLLRFQAEEKGLTFVVATHPGTPAVFRGDPLRVQQVLANLASNAVKFTETGSVSVSARMDRTGSRLRFEVRDTGPGIAVSDQERLFESFTQLDPSTTRKFGGTGLGLAICRQLVGLMGGELGVDSEVGRGSSFWFELPLPVAPAPEVRRPPAVAPPDLSDLRILVAEDNTVNQLVAREILAKAGVRPVIVSNGQQAVERVRAEAFDLVLMDLQMPVMDGLEAVRELRRTHPAESLPILALTAHTFAQERKTCLEAGMQDLVPKPVDPAVLYAVVSRWRPGGTRT